MKKSVTLLTFLFALTISHAQDNTEGFWSKVRLNAAATLGNYSFKSDTQNEDIKYSYDIGFLLGLDYEVLKKERLTVETGLSFTNHNSLLDDADLGLNIKYNTYWVGTHAMVDYQILPNKLSAGAGIFADYAIAGTQKSEGSNKVDLFKAENGGDAPLKNLNYGVTAKISYVMSWTDFADDIYVGYRLGLANIEGADDSTQTFKTGMLLIGVRANLDELF